MQSKQVQAVFGIVPLLSAALDLSGDSSKGDVYRAFFRTSEEDLYQRLCVQNERLGRMLMLYSRKFAQFFTGDMNGALETYQLCSNLGGLVMQHQKTIPHIMNCFLDGLIALHCARNHDNQDDERKKWTETAEGVIETVKSWVAASKWNFTNKCYLLEAEHHFLLSNDEMALEKYDASIAAAQSHRFVHEEGLACYLRGQFHLARGRKDAAAQSLIQAKACYERWGALKMVERLGDTMDLA